MQSDANRIFRADLTCATAGNHKFRPDTTGSENSDLFVAMLQSVIQNNESFFVIISMDWSGN